MYEAMGISSITELYFDTVIYEHTDIIEYVFGITVGDVLYGKASKTKEESYDALVEFINNVKTLSVKELKKRYK